jgi:hypothetical protein
MASYSLTWEMFPLGQLRGSFIPHSGSSLFYPAAGRYRYRPSASAGALLY